MMFLTGRDKGSVWLMNPINQVKLGQTNRADEQIICMLFELLSPYYLFSHSFRDCESNLGVF